MDTDRRNFISRVLAWPGDDDPGHVNLHWLTPSSQDPARMVWAGKPVRAIEEFLSLTDWALSKPNIKDIYYCTSRQAKINNKNGRISAARHAADAVAFKAIWIDVDVKPPPKGYATIEDAIVAIKEFVAATGLPQPSAYVGSGGGVHVYWISKTALTPEQWRPYAVGLKAAVTKHGLLNDAGVIADAARVLRVPQTFNCKNGGKLPVKLLKLRDEDYDFETDLAVLLTFAPAEKARPAAEAPFDLSMFPKRERIAGSHDSLGAGITTEYPPIPWEPVAKKCAFIHKALTTGGKDYSQPMWNLTTLAATFLENGHDLAHRMARQHEGYTVESTEALWDRKNRERKDRGLGWPSCNAIQASGCGDCATCPLLAQRKSPLNIRGIVATPTSDQSDNSAGGGSSARTKDPQAAKIDLPFSFVLNDYGLICKEVIVKKKDVEEISLRQLFTCKLSAPWAQASPQGLNFVTTTDLGNFSHVSITHEVIAGGGTDMFRTLARAGVKVYPPNEKYVKEFLMAWLTQLHDAMKATEALPFGWIRDAKGELDGFVYGGIIFKPDGTEHPSGFGDGKLRDLYRPMGELAPWLDACKLITDQKRPELDCLVASAFAAPLMISPAEASVLLSAWGTSGGNKSTAIKVGLAVWSHPKKTKEVNMTTARSAMQKMGEIKNLPVIWDDVKDKKAQKAVMDVVFGSEGIAPGRLTSNIEQRDRPDWQTMLVMCSNISFVDHVVETHKTTTAGMYRVFEYHVASKDKDEGPGRIDPIDASRLTQKLESNFGVMGMMYARLLAADPKGIDEFTAQICRDFGREVNRTEPERFWVALCGTLLAGAELANRLGCELDLVAMRAFLIETYAAMRGRMRDEAIEGGAQPNTSNVLTGFLKACAGETVWTDTFPAGAGRPKNVLLLYATPLDRGKPVNVQWAVADRVLRISKQRFTDYMTEQNIPAQQVLNGLKEFFGATAVRTNLAAGTVYLNGQEQVLNLPIAPGSELEPLMYAHSAGGGGSTETPFKEEAA